MCIRDRAWPGVSGVHVRPSWVARSVAPCWSAFCTKSNVVHVPRGRRPTGSPCHLTVIVVAAGGGRGPTALRCHPRKNRDVDSMGSDATLQNVGEIRARLQNGKVHKPNDAICEVTRRRHRVFPCRSAYWASPWCCSLWLSLRRRRETALSIPPEPWWHLRVWGSRPSHLMIIPNTKRHPNSTKTDQLPISEVITGLPRPYHSSWIKIKRFWRFFSLRHTFKSQTGWYTFDAFPLYGTPSSPKGVKLK